MALADSGTGTMGKAKFPFVMPRSTAGGHPSGTCEARPGTFPARRAPKWEIRASRGRRAVAGATAAPSLRFSELICMQNPSIWIGTGTNPVGEGPG